MAKPTHRGMLTALALVAALLAAPVLSSANLRESLSDSLHDARARWFPDHRHPMAGAVFVAKKATGAILYDNGLGAKADPKPIGSAKLSDYGPNVVGVVATDTESGVLITARERDGGTTFLKLAKSGGARPMQTGFTSSKVSLASSIGDSVVYISDRVVCDDDYPESERLSPLPEGYPVRRMESAGDKHHGFIFLSKDSQSVVPPFANRIFVVGVFDINGTSPPSHVLDDNPPRGCRMVEISGPGHSWQILGSLLQPLVLLSDETGRLFGANLDKGDPVALTPQGLNLRALSIMANGDVLGVASGAGAKGSQTPGCEPQVYEGDEAPEFRFGDIGTDHGVRCWGLPELDILAVPTDGTGPRTLVPGADLVTVDQNNSRLVYRDRATLELFELDLTHADAKPHAIKAAKKAGMTDIVGYSSDGLHICEALPFVAPFDHKPRPPRKGALVMFDGSLRPETCIGTLRHVYVEDAHRKPPRTPKVTIDQAEESAVFRVGDDGKPIQLVPWTSTRMDNLHIADDGSAVVYEESAAKAWMGLRTDQSMEATLGARRIAPISVGSQLRTATDFLGMGRGEIVLHSLGELFAFSIDGSNADKGDKLGVAELAKPMRIVPDIDRVIVDGFMPCGNGKGPVTICARPPPRKEEEKWVSLNSGDGTLTPVLPKGDEATFAGFSKRYRTAVFLALDGPAPPMKGDIWRVDFSGDTPGKPVPLATGLDVIPGESADVLADRFAILADHERYAIVPLGGSHVGEPITLALPKPPLPGKDPEAVTIEVDSDWTAIGTDVWLCLLPREPSASRQPGCRVSPYSGDHTISTTPDGRFVLVDDLLYPVRPGAPARLSKSSADTTDSLCVTNSLCLATVGDEVRTIDPAHPKLSDSVLLKGVGPVRMTLNPRKSAVLFNESVGEANGFPGWDIGGIVSWAPADALPSAVKTPLYDDVQARVSVLGWVLPQ